MAGRGKKKTVAKARQLFLREPREFIATPTAVAPHKSTAFLSFAALFTAYIVNLFEESRLELIPPVGVEITSLLLLAMLLNGWLLLERKKWGHVLALPMGAIGLLTVYSMAAHLAYGRTFAALTDLASFVAAVAVIYYNFLAWKSKPD